MNRSLSPFRRGRGFSLVELMIAIAIGGLILAAVGTVYLSSRQSFRTQDAMARIQESARYAFETMSYDIRQVGFGCETVNTGAVDATWYNNLFKRPLLGYKDGAGLPADVTDVVADTDALMVLRADKRGEAIYSGNLDGGESFDDGGFAVVTDDYSDASVYAVSDGTLVGACNTGVVPKADDPSDPNDIPSRLLPLVGHIYHIRENANGVPSLYRETLLANGTTEAQEVIEGVEDMQILFGEDTSQATLPECPDDGCSADTYATADAVTNWNRVVSVRIELNMRSTETGVAVGGDGYLRKTFTTTIAVRNRL